MKGRVKRLPFNLSHAEACTLIDTIQYDIKGMKDVLADPGYSAKEQRIHRTYVSELRKIVRRLRRFGVSYQRLNSSH